MTKVSPAAPVAPWLGGKKALHKEIVEWIDATPHRTYVEPFVGMGGVFLRRGWKPRLEVANDLNNEITNLFRILQLHYQALLDFMRFTIASRHEFERLRKMDPSTLTDLQRAARFLYLQRLNFGGKFEGTFGVAKDRPPRFSLSRLEPLLDAAHARLQNTTLECLPWQHVIRRYDDEHTLFYLDPPYWGNENDYGKGLFDRDQFQEMAEILGAIKGTFLLCLNDTPEVRETFAAFEMRDVTLKYTVSAGAATNAKELFITNKRE